MSNPRHHAEKWLEDEINAKRKDKIERVIKIIEEDTDASLSSFDENNKSFLTHALIAEEKEVFLILFNKLKEATSVIFAKDKIGRNLFSYAAEKNFADIMQALIDLAKEHHLKPWLEADAKGMTPLHYSAKFNNYDVSNQLMDEINKEGINSIEFLNRAEAEGNTPLHCLCMSDLIAPDPELIALFINRGANMYVQNDKKIKAVDLILKLNTDVQIAIVSLLKEKIKQTQFLHLYRDQMLLHPDSTDMKKIYFQLAAKKSLRAMLLAHHEFNEKMPIRNTYRRLIADDKEVDEEIPKFIAYEMPNYMTKVWAATKAPRVQLNPQLHDNWEMSNAKVPENHYETVNADRVTLTTLIDDVQDYIAYLQNNPSGRCTIPNRTLAVLVPTLYLTTFVVGEIFIWTTQKKLKHDAETQPIPQRWVAEADEDRYRSGGITFSVVAPILGVIINGYFINFLWKREGVISSKEWKGLVTTLQEEVSQKLEKLELLENAAKKTNPDAVFLPVDTTIITDLKNEMAKLNQDQSASQALTIFNQIKTILETIRMGMNQSNKPLTFFQPKESKPKELIALDVLSGEDDEDTPFLQRPESKSRGCGLQ